MKRLRWDLLIAAFIVISGCATNKVTAPGTTIILVELISNNIMVTPDTVSVAPDTEVIWQPFGGTIEIEFKVNDPKPLPKPTCEIGGKKQCKLKVPKNKKGEHPYTVYLTDANGTRHELDPVIIIEY